MTVTGSAALQGSQAAAKITHEVLAFGVAGLMSLSRTIAAEKAKQVVASPTTYTKIYSFIGTILPYAINSKIALPLAGLLCTASSSKIRSLGASMLNMPIRALNRFYGPDNVDRHAENLQGLQAANTSTDQILEEYPKLTTLLARLAQFNPSLRDASQKLAILKTETERSLEQIRQEIQARPSINLHEVEASIFFFMAELENQLSIHGENICAFPPIIEELQETETRLTTAKQHLQRSQKELKETVEKLTNLQTQVLEADLEQDQALAALMAHAQALMQSASFNNPQPN